MRLTVLLGWWQGWQPVYDQTHVDALCRMLRAHLHVPCQIVLQTNLTTNRGLCDAILPLPEDPDGLKLRGKVNCFRRLRYFDPQYNGQFGTEWIMSIDLDTLILEDLTELVQAAMNGSADLWILRGRFANRKATERPYNGALYMLRAGTNPQVWTNFDPVESPQEIARRRWVGSDQSWIGIQAPGAATWGKEDGVWFFGQYVRARDAHKRLPKQFPAPMPKIINFAGRDKPWTKPVRFQAPDVHAKYLNWLV